MSASNAGSGYNTDSGWVFIAGYSAAKLSDAATSDEATAQLHAMAERTAFGGDAYAAKPLTIMEKELQAMAKLARGQKDDAVRLAKDAADLEWTMSPSSGPPDPIKPAMELYGEVLLEAGQPSQAATAFEKALERTPNRTPLVQDIARAAITSGN